MFHPVLKKDVIGETKGEDRIFERRKNHRRELFLKKLNFVELLSMIDKRRENFPKKVCLGGGDGNWWKRLLQKEEEEQVEKIEYKKRYKNVI